MSAQIDEVSSAFPWRGRIMVIGNTERYVSVRQHAKNVWRIPTGMTEFKAVSAALRKKCQEGAEPACVRREVRRQLKENWSRLVAKDDSRSSRSCRLLIEFSDKRFQWLMNFDAFQAKTKWRPV